MNKNKRLNIIRGGVAKQIPGMPNYYFMKGLPHELGGIDIGKDLEVEGNEVVHVGKDNIKVYSSVPFLNGVSPAEKVLGGNNPTTVFREQEQFKKINGLKDDGTKKKLGGEDDDGIDFNYDPDIVGTSPDEIIKYYTNKGFGKSPITNEWGFISRNGYNYNSEGRRDRYDKEFDEVNKIGYIGGSPTEARRKFYKSDKRFTQVVDSIADSHGLPRRVLKNSLANEGFIDTAIGDINTNYLKRRKGEAGYDNLIGDNLLNKHIYNIGFTRMGNDDSKTYYNTRKDVKRIIDNSPIKWETVRNINEKDREVLTMDGSNNKANIVIHSALLTSFRNEIKKQHPNWTNDQIDNYTLYRFNYGPYAKGNINDVMKRDKFNAKNYEFRLGGKKAKYGTEDEIVSDNTRINRPLSKRELFLTYQDYAQNERKENFANYASTIGPTKGRPQGLINVHPEFDLLTLSRSLLTEPANLLKKVPKSTVRDPKYYRQVNRASRAIEDAKKSGVISAKSAKRVVTPVKRRFVMAKNFDVPFFNYKDLWFANKPELDIIVGSSNKQLRWQPITQHGTFTKNIKSVGGRRTPLFDGEANIAPTELFEFYRHYPGIGRLNVTNGFPHIPITGTNITYNMLDANKKQLGGKMNNKTSGLYNLTIDGKNSLHQFPSTGKSFARSAKGKVIARGGTKKDINIDDWYPEAMTSAINSDMSLIVPDKSTPTKLLPKPKATPLDHYNLKGTKSTAKQSKFKTFINNVFNKPNAKDIIGAGSNIVSSIIAYNMNKNMLNDLEYSPAPITRRANKLKTKININPQIDAMRESLANYRKHVNDNTASSRVARALMNRGLNSYTVGINELYGNKENQETGLINKDRLNQQEVANANIADYNTWRANKVAFNNTIREKKSENDIGLISNINAGIQDVISRGEKRFNERQNRLALMAANPNVNPSLLRDFGIEGITDEDIRNYYTAYGNKNKER